MRRQGKDFLRTVTPLFATMLIQSQAMEGEADETVHKERGDNMERAATTVASLDAESQDTILGDRPAQTRFESLSKQSNDPPLSRVNTLGSGEDSMKLNELMEIYIRLSERVLALENIKTAQDLEITNLKKRVKRLEKKAKSRTLQLKRRLFKVRIESFAEKSLGAQEDAFKHGRNEIDQDEGISWFQEDAKTQGSAPITTDEPVTTASAPITTAGVSTLMKMRSVKSKEKSKEKEVPSETATRLTNGVIMKEASETASRPIVPPQQQRDPKDKGKGIMQEPKKPVKGKDQIAYDVEVAQNLQEQLQAELEEEDRLAREKLQAQKREELIGKEQSKFLAVLIETRRKYFASKRAKENRNKPPIKAQQRNLMCTYLKNMKGYKHNDFKSKSFDAIKKMFDKSYKRVNTFVAMDLEVVEGSKKKARSSEVSKKKAGEKHNEESVKRQKLEDDAKKAELKLCLEIVPHDDKAITIEPLATKSPIVDWETQILGEELFYYQIKRADGSYKVYKGRIVGIKRHLSAVEVTTANMEVTTVGYVSTAGEDYRKYSKSLLLLE
ncbi:hypothetical protein Tco_1290983 [Tanacetum coccineum]